MFNIKKMMERSLKIILILLLFGSFSCSGEIVTPSKLKTKDVISENNLEILPCVTRKDRFNSGKSTIGWHYQQDKTKDTAKEPGIYIVGEKDQNRCGKNVEAVGNNMESWCLLPGTKHLVLKNPQRIDGGVFTCVETFEDHPEKKNYAGYEIDVRYLSKPVVIEAMGRILEGGEYSLKCQSEGFPSPNYRWYFKEKSVDSLIDTDLKESNVVTNSTSGVLTIGKFRSENVGDYVCRVDNRFFQKESDKIRLDFSVFTNLTIIGILVGGLIMLGALTGLAYYVKERLRYKRGGDADIEADCVGELNV